jgi:DNA polymerase I
LKWILVTCFGYTGYRNARFGRIECHEAICAWSREILLQTIEEAQREGFDPLHAIVDSLWLKDLENRDDTDRDAAVQRLVDRVEARIGVPLDIEDTYRWIAFLPNRTNGSAALTKYFGIGSAGWKIRGIELRQHSTCEWVRRLQRDSLEILRENPTDEAQRAVVAHLHEQLQLLRGAVVDLADLIVARRVRREVEDARTENLTTAALRRAAKLQRRIPPGHKTHFAVVGWRRQDIENRVRLKSEIESNAKSIEGQFGDAEYYTPLAVRAVSAILSPFGWSDERIGEGALKQSSLDAW